MALSLTIQSQSPTEARVPAACADTFETTTVPYLNELYRTAIRLVRNPATAEDCVQETYLRARRTYHRFQPGTNCRAWLFTILLNVVRHHRRDAYRASTVANFELVVAVLPAPTLVESLLSDEEILLALDQIHQSYREAVLLCDVHDFTYQEACGILQVPIGTVMSRLSRGREALRKKLASRRHANGFA
ncbi:MAG: sigma-70 family RNA polymerase sigma factor [Bryobacteraceae bacterium]|nr:sigma-70 family RNA polymerase sigma factor [Bryobacteraceae bacterium]